MLFDSLLLLISGIFATGLVITEPVVSSRMLAISLFAVHVMLYWLVVIPYHSEKIDAEALDNIELM